MASKAIYSGVAVVGIAVASGAAWWLQNKPSSVRTAAGALSTATGAPGATAGAAAPRSGASASGQGSARPASVEVASVEVMKLVDDTQAVGNLRSRQGVMLRPEVSGRVTQIHFRDGDRVRKGQLLVQLDDQLPLAQIKQSQAELSIAMANHKRNQDLVAQNFISQRSVDESAANLEVAQAKLALAQATAARLRIVAPFDGMTGIRLINPGDYLKDGADIVNIEDIEAVYVDFRLPERFQTKIKRGQRASVDLDALPGRRFVAVVSAIDPLIDASGRSVGVRACIDNRQLQLRPGMFARVNAVFGERSNAKVVPEEAIVPLGGRQYVIRVVDGPDKDTKVSQRVEVKLGIRRPGRVEILDGLNEGDTVVVAGQQRLQRDGSPLRINDVGRGPGPQPGAAGAAGGAGAPPAAVGKPGTAVAAPGPRQGGNAVEGPNPCLAEMAGGGSRGAGAGGRPGAGPRGAATAPAKS